MNSNYMKFKQKASISIIVRHVHLEINLNLTCEISFWSTNYQLPTQIFSQKFTANLSYIDSFSFT